MSYSMRALIMAADRIDLQNIKVVRKYATEICHVSVDKVTIKIAFLNIILNAVEAMESKAGILKFKQKLKTINASLQLLIMATE